MERSIRQPSWSPANDERTLNRCRSRLGAREPQHILDTITTRSLLSSFSSARSLARSDSTRICARFCVGQSGRSRLATSIKISRETVEPVNRGAAGVSTRLLDKTQIVYQSNAENKSFVHGINSNAIRSTCRVLSKSYSIFESIFFSRELIKSKILESILSREN